MMMSTMILLPGVSIERPDSLLRGFSRDRNCPERELIMNAHVSDILRAPLSPRPTGNYSHYPSILVVLSCQQTSNCYL